MKNCEIIPKVLLTDIIYAIVTNERFTFINLV